MWELGFESALSLPWPFPFVSFTVVMCVSSCWTPLPHFMPLYLVELWAVVCYFFLHIFIGLLRTFFFFFNFSLAVLSDFWIRLSGHWFRVWFYSRRREKERNSRGIILKREKKKKPPAKGRWPCPCSALTREVELPQEVINRLVVTVLSGLIV